MKIKYKEGNLIIAPERLIAHGCNAQGKMNSGVARQIRNRFPEAFHEYIRVYNTYGLKLGDIIFKQCDNNKIIANCITQQYYGRDGKQYVSYDAIRKIFKELDDQYYEGIKEVAMPRIGAGLGGGNWGVISAIIEQECKLIQPVVYDYE